MEKSMKSNYRQKAIKLLCGISVQYTTTENGFPRLMSFGRGKEEKHIFISSEWERDWDSNGRKINSVANDFAFHLITFSCEGCVSMSTGTLFSLEGLIKVSSSRSQLVTWAAINLASVVVGWLHKKRRLLNENVVYCLLIFLNEQ